MALLHLFWQERVLHALGQRELVSGLLATTLLLIIYWVLNSVYYRAFHPLSRFTGPSGAATSRHWVYRVTDRGFPEEDFERLHKQYREYNHRLSFHRVLNLIHRRNACATNWSQ